MTDFIADLEAELVAAARRRATRRQRVLPVPRLRPVTALAFVALAAFVVALFLVARGLDGGSRPADERPGVPPGPGVSLALPAAPVAQPCPGAEQREVAGGVQHPLSIFDRPGTAADAVPPLAGADSFSWIPAANIHRVDARRAAPDRFAADVYLVPAAGPRRGGACDGREEAVLAVCLVVVGNETVVRCFSEDEVEGGRALAVTGPGAVHGVVPDGVNTVTLSHGGARASAPVVDNAFEIAAPVRAGQTVQVEQVSAPTCDPSRALIDAVPALEDARWVFLPETVERAVSGAGDTRFARRLEDRDGFELWVFTHCDDARQACVVALREGRWIAQPCGTAPRIRERGSWSIFEVGDRLAVVGMAPAGATGARAVLGDGDASHPMELDGGVFAALLPEVFGPSSDPANPPRPIVVRFR